MIIYKFVIYFRFWLINRVAMDVKGNGGCCCGRKLWTPSLLQSNGRFKRLALSTDLFRAPNIYSIFRALKNHVDCHRYDNYGRHFATWRASVDGESKCCSAGRRIRETRAGVGWAAGRGFGGHETILKIKVAIKNN